LYNLAIHSISRKIPIKPSQIHKLRLIFLSQLLRRGRKTSPAEKGVENTPPFPTVRQRRSHLGRFLFN
jgi:hypothetical protein